MADYRDYHATIVLAPELAGPIEALRREWDPDMAAQIAAHVTVAYPREAPIADLLVDRVREASERSRPFRLRLGGIACFERPEHGVYVAVEDVDGGYRMLREHVLRPPSQDAAFPAHVTLVHPRTSHRGLDFWERGGYQPQNQEFTAKEVAITAFDGARWVVLATYTLAATR